MDGAAAEIRLDAPGPGWLPIRVGDEAEPTVRWAWFGDRRLSDAFYEMDARRARWDGPSLTTRLADLAAHAAAVEALEPAGFIFHMSRCGSTLAARMLGAPPEFVAISEAPPLDAVVRRRDPELLRAMVRALGRVRAPGQARLFLKLDCWHALDLPLFRQAFPQTPWVFLYREPAAVLASHVRACGIQMVADRFGPAFWGLEPTERPFGPGWYAQVLAAICEAGARGAALGGGLYVNYAELPEALFGRVLPHFGVKPTAAQAEAMRRMARLDAKAAMPTPFTASPTPARLDPGERPAAAYAALEALNAARRGPTG